MGASQAAQLLSQYWGYPSFRQGQAEVIEAVTNGQDTLALLPTGGGKSVTYQIPALMGVGLTLVISPLIALMKDQVDQLKKKGIRAEAIHSGMRFSDIDRILDNAVYGGVKLLYVAPERLRSDLAETRIRQMKIDLIAVDEAHCISEWGYDFRPAYLEIATIRQWLPNVPVLALTATAIPEVVRDIQEKLSFTNAKVVKTTFGRSNLGIVVEDRPDKEQAMLNWLKGQEGAAIVYVRSRKRSADYATFLSERGIPAHAFHAGLSASERIRLQEAWQKDEFPVMVATNAFGMGIDKADVRVVVHMDLPDSLEAYYQEAGRAGRDGLPARAVLLAGRQELDKLTRQFEEQFPPLQVVRQVYRALGSYFQLAYGGGEMSSFDFDLLDFAHRYHFQPYRALSALKILEESGWLTLTEGVYQPATLWLKAGPQDLYQYRMKNKKIDMLVKSVQRLYQGLYQYPVAIQISQIMHVSGLSESQVHTLLDFLHQSDVVDFRPMKDKPQLQFLMARQDADQLQFDTRLLNFRKERQRNRIRAIDDFLHATICRQQSILYYFGEQTDDVCGHCDLCLLRIGEEIARPADEEIRSRLLQLFGEQEEWSITDIQRLFPSEQTTQIKRILQHWSDEGLIRESYGKLILDR